MIISSLLLVLLTVFVWGLEDGAGPVPCFPKCPLSEEGRRLCESLLALKPCVDRIKQQGADGSLLCSCQWSAVLSHPSYSNVPDSSECFQYSLNTCETKTRLPRDTTESDHEYSIGDFLREIQNENSRIQKITEESKKQDAKIKLLNAVYDVIELIRRLDESNKGNPGYSISEGTGQPATTASNWDLNMMTGGWEKFPATTKKPSTEMHPLKNDRRFHIALFAGLVLLILIVIVLCLLAKIRNDRTGVNLDIVGDLDLDNRREPRWSFGTLLETLRLRYREKAMENATRGQSIGSVRSHSKSAKPDLTVPTKSSVERRNSNTSLKSVAGQTSDSCTMISGLTHGNTSGSDLEIDNEFRMLRANFKQDFKSLLNLNQHKQ